LRLPLRPRLEGGARRFRAGQELAVVDAADTGPLDLGQQRTARIGLDRRNRARTRSEAEALPRHRGLRGCVICRAIGRVLGHRAPPIAGRLRLITLRSVTYAARG